MQFKHTLLILALFTIHSSLFTLPAAVPLRWTVETSRAQVAQFEAYRGETLLLEATMQSYGKPYEEFLQPDLYWQTNGMGSAWWKAPATFEGNVLKAYWSPTNDCGGTVYNCFIGGPDATYRAAFRLRMLPSPGFTPNQLKLPTVTYDAALFGEPTVNGTNLTEWVAARSQAESDPVFREWVRTNDFSSAGGSASGVDTNAVNDLISSAIGSITPQSIGAQPPLPVSGVGAYDVRVSFAYNALDAQSAEWAVRAGEAYRVDWDNVDGKPDLADREMVDDISNTVSAWQTYWDGDDVRVTVTNYYGNLDHQSLYLEQKMPADADHSASWFKTIWDERTRWNAFLAGYASLTNHVHQNLADRAWGLYDSSTGAYSPDGLLQLSQEQIMIAPGMSYQKTVTAGGNAYWVLRANDPTTVSGVTSNGFFRIEDFDGNALFEIVKGDKRVVGANIASINKDGDVVTLTFNVNSDEHPDVYFSDRLSNGEWHRVESRGAAVWLDHHWEVEWSGTPGAWVASIKWESGFTVKPFPVPPPSGGFFRATYEAGGNTYIRNNVATSIDKVVVGGIEYTVTVETVNGKKLLVLQ